MKILNWEEFWKEIELLTGKHIKRLQYAEWHKEWDREDTVISLLAITKSNNGNLCGFYKIYAEEGSWYCYHWLSELEKEDLMHIIEHTDISQASIVNPNSKELLKKKGII